MKLKKKIQNSMILVVLTSLIRQKLGTCGEMIETVRGVGYRMRE